MQEQAEDSSNAQYLYCIANSPAQVTLGEIGIEGNEVYTIAYKDLCVVVHDCAPQPYESEDEQMVKEWVVAHVNVVEAAWERFGTVIPFRFDTIIDGAQENVTSWLKETYEDLKHRIIQFEGLAEYGVQIFWDPEIIIERVSGTDTTIKELNQKIAAMSEGTAYLHQQKLVKLLKEKVEEEADRCFRDCYNRIRVCIEDIQVGRVKQEKEREQEQGKQMLANLACLAEKPPRRLGEELGKIARMDGFSVRFTGPWPPYSFAD
ncbi:MAG: gas vesicle protein GvpL [Candidatus Bipolaricaulia bacterium]